MSEHDDLIRRAKEEWQMFFLMTYHNTPSGTLCADLGEADVRRIKDLIRELAAMLAMETGTSLDV